MRKRDLIINLTYYHVAKDVPENSLDIAVVIDVLRELQPQFLGL